MRFSWSIPFLALCVAALSASSPASDLSRVTDRPDRLKCGLYELRGKLGSSPSGGDYIELLPGTTNKFDITLLRLKPVDTMAYEDRLVAVEAEIIQGDPAKGFTGRVVRLKGSVTQRKAFDSPLRLIQEKPCS